MIKFKNYIFKLEDFNNAFFFENELFISLKGLGQSILIKFPDPGQAETALGELFVALKQF